MKKLLLSLLVLLPVLSTAQNQKEQALTKYPEQLSMVTDYDGYFYRSEKYPTIDLDKHNSVDFKVVTKNGSSPSFYCRINYGTELTYYQLNRRIEVYQELRKQEQKDIKPKCDIVEEFRGDDGYSIGYHIDKGWDEANWENNKIKIELLIAIRDEMKKFIEEYSKANSTTAEMSANFLSVSVAKPVSVDISNGDNHSTINTNNIGFETPILNSKWIISEETMLVEITNKSTKTISIDLPNSLFVSEDKYSLDLLCNGLPCTAAKNILPGTKKIFEFQPAAYMANFMPLTSGEEQISVYLPIKVGNDTYEYIFNFK